MDAKSYIEDKACLKKSRAELREQEKKQSQMITRFYNYEAKRREKMSEIKFIDGTKVKKVKDEFYGISFSEKFIDYFKQNQKNGYLNVNLCKSKDKDKWYLRLNEWTPDKRRKYYKCCRN